MLDASKLRGAGAAASKNELIRGLLNEVNSYNSIVSPVNSQPKADQLLRVCQVGSWYCTSKPPQPPKAGKPGGGKNALRWAAVKDLLEQVGNEAQTLNLRMLRGPTDFKKVGSPMQRTDGTTIWARPPAAGSPGIAHVHSSYWLELADPEHRAGHDLARRFADWLTDADAVRDKTSFWEHIGTDNTGLAEDIVVKYYPELVGQANKYMASRGMLRFNVDGLLVDLSDDPWDTMNTVTHFSGRGWGIFVVSPSGTIFGGTHRAGKHHHSSFLGGGAVMAAGEMACFGGVPRFITAKSGHYGPSSDNLHNFVNKCPQIRGDALIMPGFGTPKFYTVQDFRANGSAATPLTKAQVTAYLQTHHGAASFTAPNGSTGFRAIWDKLT